MPWPLPTRSSRSSRSAPGWLLLTPALLLLLLAGWLLLGFYLSPRQDTKGCAGERAPGERPPGERAQCASSRDTPLSGAHRS
ncbi:hypothetical protein ACF068_04815 [Streptomyces sp. NPDC016309]|uniref:hypothetical protein n=1 Tax=Streptomyces sp. NPDC016309 TaxID=3364965 RepID=UPI0036F973FE